MTTTLDQAPGTPPPPSPAPSAVLPPLAVPAAPPASTLADAIATNVSQTLVRRGYLTTEWWTTIIGAALSCTLALVGVHGPAATQVVAIAAPVLLAVAYAAVRSMHKSQLARVLADALPPV